jgi:7-cyano-7-deazaguanine synthase
MALAQEAGFDTYCLSFRYGQRHAQELLCAEKIALAMGAARHVVVDIDLRTFGGSALTADMEVPKDRLPDDLSTGIPITYVPARNTVFLSFALAWAEVLNSTDIFIGVNALDYSGYPDCRPDYIAAYERMANLATRAGVEGSQRLKIHTPLISLTKAQIIQEGLRLGVDYSLTMSCYDPSPSGQPCGCCDACQLRQRGFKQLGIMDPALSSV